MDRELRCWWSGRLAPPVDLVEGTIGCGCGRRIKVLANGHICHHKVPEQLASVRPDLLKPASAECWVRGCDHRVIARGMCWRHYRRMLRLNLGAAATPVAVKRAA